MGLAIGSPDALSRAIAAAQERASAVLAETPAEQAALPLRYWRQHAHYTVPADDAVRAGKALTEGTGAMARLLDRFEISAADLAARLEVDAASVERLLATPRAAPLVMLDGEDAQAPGPEAEDRTVRNVAELLGGSNKGDGVAGSLRFFRPPGPSDPDGIRVLVTVLHRLAEHIRGDGAARTLPLDGIVVPKVRDPAEIDLVDAVLSDAERDLSLAPGSIRIAVLIESGWAVARLPEIAARAARRLSALIYGPVDHASDIGLPTVALDHPVALQARAAIVNVAGAVGVPAIDGMTLAYPVPDAALDQAANRARFLDRVALVHREARAARALGMLGKWVGHPAQLFATMLAFQEGAGDDELAAEAEKLERYRDRTAAGEGAAMIAGEMADRATDRHARMLLRRAVADGRFDPERALTLGVITADELADARALGSPRS